MAMNHTPAHGQTDAGPWIGLRSAQLFEDLKDAFMLFGVYADSIILY